MTSTLDGGKWMPAFSSSRPSAVDGIQRNCRSSRNLFGNRENVHGNRGSSLDVPLESEQPKSGWHSYLPEDHDTFVKLPWYLVADAVLVKRVPRQDCP